MNKFTAIFIVLCLMVFTGCRTNKTVAETNVSSEIDQDMINEKMREQGYKKGLISASTNDSSCPYTIAIEEEDYPYLLDPTNLEEDFMVDGFKVWFKFTSLRMASRCSEANPIRIEDIKKREG